MMEYCVYCYPEHVVAYSYKYHCFNETLAYDTFFKEQSKLHYNKLYIKSSGLGAFLNFGSENVDKFMYFNNEC